MKNLNSEAFFIDFYGGGIHFRWTCIHPNKMINGHSFKDYVQDLCVFCHSDAECSNQSCQCKSKLSAIFSFILALGEYAGDGHTCQLCPAGYTGGGLTCVDVDECSGKGACIYTLLV